jgi:hypothetical protein
LPELVDVIDRFIDGTLKYRLEWDDFISWENENGAVEAIRDKIAALEPMFFSAHLVDRSRALALLVEERNRAAALCGRSSRAHVALPA